MTTEGCRITTKKDNFSSCQ